MFKLQALILGIALVAGPSAAFAAKQTEFQKAFVHYEAIRQALIDDHVKEVPDHAKSLVGIFSDLAKDFDPDRAGVKKKYAEDVREMMPELVKAATAVASAEGIAKVREAYYALSKPMIRWREWGRGARPQVVYCSMAEKSWLQPEEPIGNPYYGKSMLRCGSIASK